MLLAALIIRALTQPSFVEHEVEHGGRCHQLRGMRVRVAGLGRIEVRSHGLPLAAIFRVPTLRG